MLKTCSQCGQEKSTDEFYPLPTRRCGVRSNCKVCAAKRDRSTGKPRGPVPKYETEKERQKAKVEAGKRFRMRRGKDYARDHQLQHKFNITLDDYNRMFAEQNGCCVLCDRHQSEFKTRLAVDHNHETGGVRGLLCTRCNIRLGVLENRQFIEKAIKYLGD